MSKSLVLSKKATEKDVIKNVADFFYESIIDFKRTLSDLSLSINNFLSSLNVIEKQLGMHGFDFPENSSDVLFERLTQNKQVRENKQKEFIDQLIKRPITTPEIPIKPKDPLQPLPKPTPPPMPKSEQVSTQPPSQPKIPQEHTIVPIPVEEQVEPPKIKTESLEALKKEMLETVRMLKKRIKNYK